MNWPRAIFFDMDGTILDWQVGMEEAWLAACEDNCHGLFAPSEMHAAIRARRTWFWDDPERSHRGRLDLDAASREIVRLAFEDSGLTHEYLAHRIADQYRARRIKLIAPYPGAIETLETLRSHGVRMALLTNGGAKSQRRSVDDHRLDQYFDCIVIEGEFGVGKPDERVFRHALASCGVSPGEAWMVGDNFEADIVTPHRIGMHTIWIDAEDAGPPADAGVTPHRIIRGVAELLD